MGILQTSFHAKADHLPEAPNLYHGSPYSLNILEPRPAPTTSGLEGAFVFATSNINAAQAYALKNDACYYVRLTPGFDHLHMCLFVDRPDLSRYDMEGVIYKPAATTIHDFTHSQGKEGLALDEWISRTAVAVELHEKVTLESVMRQGVQAFFVSLNAPSHVAGDIWNDNATSFKDSKLAYYIEQGFVQWENQLAGLDPVNNPGMFQRPVENRRHAEIASVACVQP